MQLLKPLAYLLLVLFISSCNSQEDKDPGQLIPVLDNWCNLSYEASLIKNDSINEQLQLVQSQLDSMTMNYTNSEIQILSSKVLSCVKLYRNRSDSPRPLKKTEYIDVQ